MTRRHSRRNFLRTSALTGTTTVLLSAAPAFGRTRPIFPDKVRFGCIGVGGKGDSDSNDAGTHGQIVALCDIDENTLKAKAEKYPDAKTFIDFREMLAEMGDKLDAVTVSTADHTHAPAAAMAMRMGKHAFVQKPLTWSIEEARLLRKLAADKKLCTQMGNQGTAANGFRDTVELLKAEALGPIKEIHVWTNRPIWPQGIGRPQGTEEIPKNLHWDEFLAASPERPYHSGYTPFNWRGWLDWGTGALGDMACHTINVAAMGLELFNPESAEVLDTSGIVDNETYPSWTIIKTQFAQRGKRAPLSLTWYDGGEKLPEDKRAYRELMHGHKPGGSGLLIVGENASLYSENDYGAESIVLPEDKKDSVKRPESSLPRSPGHFKEFVQAIEAGEPTKALSNFDYAAQLTETVLLGVVALKAGKKIEWDAATMTAKGCPEADKFIRRDYRKGYSIHELGV
jgi:predicted dehydrogenase